MNKYKVIWSPKFIRKLDNILAYISFDLKEPMVAKNFYNKVLKCLATIEYFPEIHSKFYINNIIHRKIIIKNYIIIYKVDSNSKQIFILNIFHSSQNYFNKL